MAGQWVAVGLGRRIGSGGSRDCLALIKCCRCRQWLVLKLLEPVGSRGE